MSIREFQFVGPAEPPRARTASLIDFAAAFVAAVIAFPFPFARAVLPVPIFVDSILLSIIVVHVLYCWLTLGLLGRTPGMFLLDLGPGPKRPGLAAALLWALGSSLAFWPTVLGVRGAYDPETGPAARMSRIRIGSTKA
ncbi:MAG: hypothetical protein L6413_04805 [Coriobacteriia bacterium]|nr:hypothetical protein [Coriobacteriia bacterium]